jgi:PAS domain S-box-containing protein
VNKADSSDRQRWADLAEEMAGLGNWRRDVGAQTMYWSPNMFRLFGMDPGPGPSLAQVLQRAHPEDEAAARTWIQNLASGRPGTTLTRIIWPDGQVRWLEGRAACEIDDDGVVIAFYGVFMDVTQRQEADAALAAQKVHLDLLSEHGGDIIFELNLDRTIRYVSRAVRKLGYEPEQLIGRKPGEFVHPDDLPKILRLVTDYLAEKPIDPLDDRSYRMVKADGGSVWMEGRPTRIFNAAGEMTGAISIMRDVNARRLAEIALAEREAQMRVVVDHTRDVVMQYDLDHRIIYVSSAARRYGYEPDSLVGMPATEMIHPDDRARVQVVVAELLADIADPARDRKFRVRAADGAYFWVEGQPEIVRDSMGKPISVVSLLRDIEEQKAAADALAESERRYRLLTDHATDIIACYGEDGDFTFLSPSIATVLGYAPEELIGRHSRDTFMHPDDVQPVWQAFSDFFTDKPDAGSTRVEYRAFRKDGEMIWLEAHPRAIYGADGVFVEFQDVIRDVTVHKGLAEELSLARDAAETSAAVKSDFMANMSHEIRTPLTAVIGFSSLISARADLDPTAREHADRIAGAGRALLALVNDVLDFSKLEAGRMELAPRPVDPAAVAREALDLFTLQAEAKGLDLVFAPGDSMPDCLSLDPKAIGQILLNLIGNAVKFSDAGSVRLTLSHDPAAQVLQFEIHDSGPGLSPDQAARLFQRFSQVDASSTRRHGGTGLGLAICKGLVEAMDGEIGVDSVPGQGSTFWFAIPAMPATAAPVASNDGDEAWSLEGLRLLVIDDNPINRELVRAVLQPMGVEVAEAVDGANGLEIAGRRPFDIILLDIRMPGLDGPAVLARLRAEEGPNRDIPILAFSAEIDAAAASAGFDDFVGKPLDPSALIYAIARWTAYDEASQERDADAG